MADWTFRYRSETWVLPRQWLTSRYLPDFWRVLSSKDPSFRYGLCNSVSDTLDFVWQPFSARCTHEPWTNHATSAGPDPAALVPAMLGRTR